MNHDLRVASVAPPGPDNHAVFGTITPEDAAILGRRGTGNNAVAGASPARAIISRRRPRIE